MGVIPNLLKDLVPGLGPQVSHVIERLLEALHYYPLNHQTFKHNRSFQNSTQADLKME